MLSLEELTKDALAEGLDRALVHQFVDRFPLPTQLLVPNIGSENSEKLSDYYPVAELSLEDSGYGPLLWLIAILYLKNARATQSGDTN